jgi:hypothetical protein
MQAYRKDTLFAPPRVDQALEAQPLHSAQHRINVSVVPGFDLFKAIAAGNKGLAFE